MVGPNNLIILMTIERFGMTGPESFLLTNKSRCLSVDGIDDVQDFQDTLVCFLLSLANFLAVIMIFGLTTIIYYYHFIVASNACHWIVSA